MSPQRINIEPQVNPPPKAANNKRAPFSNKLASTASSNAIGIFPAVVLPLRLILTNTFSLFKPHRLAAASIIRRFG